MEYADRDGNSLSGRDRYRSLQISQVFLKGSRERGAAVRRGGRRVPADQHRSRAADRAPGQRRCQRLRGSVSGKAWVNQILETNPVPVIWVTNRIEQIDPAFRRRFQYHLLLKSPPPGAREALVARALAGAPVGEGFAAKLAERRALTPAQIRTAVRFAQLAHDGGDATSRR